MKSITRIARRLMLVFLALVASSTMFFSSPAIAATSSLTLLTPNNFETEVARSDKLVLVILASKDDLQQNSNYLENLKTEAEQIFGDNYKIVAGKIEENPRIYDRFFPLPTELPRPAIGLYVSGRHMGGFTFPPTESTSAFEFFKKELVKYYE